MTDRPVQRWLNFQNPKAIHHTRPVSAALPVSQPPPEPPDTKTPSLTKNHVPFPYQTKGINWLYARARALLADEMGLGKTIQVLRALPRNTPTLIVCPASLRLNWRDECLEWRPELHPIVCKPGELVVPRANEVSIISYESLPEPSPNARSWLVPDQRLAQATLVVDEAQYCKNHRAQRTKKVRLLSLQCARAWPLTGTPMLGSPFDLWGVLSTFQLEKQVFGPGNAWNNFHRLYGSKRNRWGGTEFAEEPPGAEEIRKRLGRVALRRLKKDVLPDLPGKMYQDIAISVPLELQQELDEIDKQWENKNDLPSFEMLSTVRAKLARARIPDLIEQVERFESERIPLVVFSAHREPVEALGGRTGWGVITGESAHDHRRTVIDCFQTGLLSGIALTIQAGGLGITLTRASTVLFADLAYTPAENVQAEDRLVRIGQEARGVQIVRLVADHAVDRRVLEILTDKQKLIDATTGGKLGDPTAYSPAKHSKP